jgi:hypothetical protein
LEISEKILSCLFWTSETIKIFEKQSIIDVKEPIILMNSTFGFAKKLGSKKCFVPKILCSKASKNEDFPVP